MGTVEPGLPLGPAGAGGSAVTRGVPAVDQWMGGDGSEAIPEVLAEGGSSDAMSHELMEGDNSGAAPHEPMEGGGSGAAPHEPMDRGGSGAVPSETRGTSPLPRSRGQARNGPAHMSWGRGSGFHPRNVPAAQKR